MKYETCLFCTLRSKCLESKFLLCNGKPRSYQWDRRDPYMKSFNRKKLRCGSILKNGCIVETYFFDEENVLYLGCVKEDGTLTSIHIDDAVNTQKNCYQSADGLSINPVLPKYLSFQGWSTIEAQSSRTRPEDVVWHITVYRDIYCKFDRIYCCHIVSKDMSIAFHERTKKEIVKYLNKCAEYYSFNPKITFIYGVDFSPDMFNCFFIERKGFEKCS